MGRRSLAFRALKAVFGPPKLSRIERFNGVTDVRNHKGGDPHIADD